MRVSGDPTAPSIVMLPQLPLAPDRVNRMGELLVPSASRRPPLATVRFTPEPNWTTAPGSIVSVTPLLIVRFPQTTMGLLLIYQVVLTAIAPLMQPGPLFVTSERSGIWMKSLLARVLFT